MATCIRLLLALLVVAGAACREDGPGADPAPDAGGGSDAGPAIPGTDGGTPMGEDAGTPMGEDAGTPAGEDAGLPDTTTCDVAGLRFEGTYADSEPTLETGRLDIHFDPWPTVGATGPCDAVGGEAWPSGWWGQGVRHGRTAIVQSRQHGSVVCAAVATAAHDILYEGTIAPDCTSMSGTYSGTMDDGTPYRGSWTVTVVR